MFTFTPLLGAQSSSHASQSILELDGGVKILVDVGWDENFDASLLHEVEKQTSNLSFILLTHATLNHLGAFAHCCKHIPHFSQIPVYATSPVIAFGRTLLQDVYASSTLAATFIPSTNILLQQPTAEEISKYFSNITPLKYSQPFQPTPSQFSAPLEGLTLTTYNSGHTLGGTIWHIQHGMESIVYAVDWNQARENIIAGAAWFGGVGGGEVIEQLRKPTALVCSSVGGDKIAPAGGRKARDSAFLGHIRSCIAKGGSVLIPTDSSARVLELAWILEKAWQEAAADPTLKAAKVYMASKSANATLRHARSLLEWMDDSIVREFEGEDDTTTKTHRRSGSKQVNGTVKPSRPFEFRHVKIVERRAQLERALKGEGPRVILASDLSLDWGYSAEILEQISQNTHNLVILTERSVSQEASNPSKTLWEWFDTRPDGVALEKSLDNQQIEQVHGGSRPLKIRTAEKVALDEQEVQQYQQYIATQRQMKDSLSGDQDAGAGVVDDTIDDDSSSSSSEESDNEQQGRALNVSAAIGHAGRNKLTLTDEDLGVNILLRKQGVFDFDVRNKKGRNAIFPYTHSRRRTDEFGDLIKPEEFLREEEKEEEAQTNLKVGDRVGQKRKWDDGKKEGRLPNKKQDKPAIKDESESESDESDEGEPEPEGFQGPAKVQYSEKTIQFNARLAHVDFSGLHDQRSLQMLIPLIGPKKLILTAGSDTETAALAADCKDLLGIKVVGAEDEPSTEIFTPANGESVDASVDTNAWTVKLSRSLARKLHWQQVKNVGVLTLQAQLKAESTEDDESKSKKQKLDAVPEETHELFPVLDMLPASLAASTRSVAQPIHVGDMRLADLRRIMGASGHSAEFRGEGTLLVDGIIAVRKLASGKIIVEGVPVNTVAAITTRTSDSFTRVKRQIYEGLAVVAAG
jgi:cleavage and polyadenylation specificity factor subunit 2